jgi:hypothetical protein
MAVLPFGVVSFTDTITLTNSPLAVREILAQTSWRLKLDLSPFKLCRVRLNVQTAGAVNSDVHFEASPDGSSWYDISPEIPIGSTGAKDGGDFVIPPQARVDGALVRMMEKDGDGVADPILRQILLAFGNG